MRVPIVLSGKKGRVNKNLFGTKVEFFQFCQKFNLLESLLIVYYSGMVLISAHHSGEKSTQTAPVENLVKQHLRNRT